MNRRDLLTGLALSATAADTQPPGSGSLYIPKAHLVEDRAFLHDFMDSYGFVDLVTASPAIRITHIPVLLDRTAGPYGVLYGHIARNNPQTETFDGGHSAVIVFRGPHSYISPTWYTKKEAVPTWNFAVVHAGGRLKAVTDRKALGELLAKLVRKFENRYAESSYDLAKLPDGFIDGMIGGIAGFEMQIDTLEGKFKLGQERSEADKAAILRNLQAAKQEPSMHDFTESFYQRSKKP
jgi:transcriptional regulator